MKRLENCMVIIQFLRSLKLVWGFLVQLIVD